MSPATVGYMASELLRYKLSGVPGYANGYFLHNFSWSIVASGSMNVRTKFEVRSSTRSSYNRGSQKIWQSLYSSTLPFFRFF